MEKAKSKRLRAGKLVAAVADEDLDDLLWVLLQYVKRRKA